jgi:3-isopropylmalate dehydrogenase
MSGPPAPEIVLLGGEGVGPEVAEATAEVLAALLPGATFVRPLHGQAALDDPSTGGDAMPEEARSACREADAILFGATGGPSHPVLRFLRWGLDTYANLRPAKSLPGRASPLAGDPRIDLLVVRENLEGEYPGREGEVADFRARWPEFRDNLGRELPADGLFTLRLTTEDGSRRVARVAARQALARRGHVTLVTKANILRKTDGAFRAWAEEELAAAGVEHRHLYVDDACRRLVAEPERFDVILAPNLFGDILSDVAAELTGGMGLAPSACIGDRHAYFESVHGSAPDIAGRGTANPLATVRSAVLMLDHLGFATEARTLDGAVHRLLAAARPGDLTPDVGGTATTAELTRALLRELEPATTGAPP